MKLRKKKEKKKKKKRGVYRRISAIFPKRLVDRFEKLLIYADMEVDPRTYLGFITSFPVLIALLVFFLTNIFLEFTTLWSLVSGVVAYIIGFVILYMHLSLLADTRAKRIDKMLPESLQLVSANVRAGMTVDKALWLSARPEFGPLEKELRKMAAQTLGGKSIVSALKEAGKRVKSKIYNRAMLLLTQGIELGGELSGLLSEIAADIRQAEALKKEIGAVTAMYTIFIIFASVLAAPALFAVSTFYVESTEEIWSGAVSEDVGGDIGMDIFKISEMSITPEEVRLFSLSSIIITTFFSALILGLIREGKAKRGVKLIPVFMLTALAIYFTAYTVIKGLFGSLLM